jgi:hypothetical protein
MYFFKGEVFFLLTSPLMGDPCLFTLRPPLSLARHSPSALIPNPFTLAFPDTQALSINDVK